MNPFAGKVALIIGGNAGSGRATAIEFAKQGATVVISARREQEGRDVVAEINALGGTGMFVRTDVSQEREVQAMVAQTLATFGRLDCASFVTGHTVPIDGGYTAQ
jgi:NAD(P)-dependent dehydrogenase (short-subunit alcohol dehydrogenase family)